MQEATRPASFTPSSQSSYPRHRQARGAASTRPSRQLKRALRVQFYWLRSAVGRLSTLTRSERASFPWLLSALEQTAQALLRTQLARPTTVAAASVAGGMFWQAAMPPRAQAQSGPGGGVGAEFLVNTFTASRQQDATVAMAADGNFVVAWDSYGQDGENYGIYAQRYNSAGLPQGGEFRVNTYTTNGQLGPVVAMDADGDFVVAWQSGGGFYGSTPGPDGDSFGIYAQRYNAAGTPQGAEFRVNTYTTNSQKSPAVAMDADGDFVVAWVSNLQDGDSYGIYAQRYNAAGLPQGNEFRVNTYTTNSQKSPAVAMDADGDFVIAWVSNAQDGESYGVYAQRYNAAGTPQGAEFRVNTYTTNGQFGPAVAMDADGDFVIAWSGLNQGGASSPSGVYAQRYSAAGIPRGSEFRVNAFTTTDQYAGAVTVDADGDFMVVWNDGLRGGDSGVYARRYNAIGVAQGGEFRVDTSATTTMSYRAAGSVAGDADGNLVVAWSDYAGVTSDGNDVDVRARRFQTLPEGASDPVGPEFRVNTFTTNFQTLSAMAMDADGDFVVAWTSAGQDGDGDGVFAQRYSASGTAQGGELRVNTHTTSFQRTPAVAADADGDFVVVWESSYQDDNGGTGIYAQRYNAVGAAQGGEFRVNTFTTGFQRLPAVAMDVDGDFIVAWESGSFSPAGQDGSDAGIYAQRFNAAGAPQGTEFRVNTFTTGRQQRPAVAVDADGDFVVAWESYGQDGNLNGVYARRFNAADATQGGEFRVNTVTSQSQSFPAVAMDADGDFVVAWASNGQDGSNYGIYAQRFNAAGAPQGIEFRVNAFTTDRQTLPAVAMDTGGNFVVTWTSEGQDGDLNGIYAQRYNAVGTALGGEFRVNTFTTGFQSFPAVAMDADGDFAVAWESASQDGSGNGIFAQRYAKPAALALPLAPTGLSATAITAGGGSLALVWTDNASTESSFRLEQRQGAGPFTLIAAPGTDATSFTVDHLAPGQRYTFRLRAVNRAGTSAFSNEASGVIPLTFVQWQARFFTETELNDPAIGGAGADPDNDGDSNEVEYRSGTLPKLAGSGGAVSRTAALLGSDGSPTAQRRYLTLTYPRSLAAIGDGGMTLRPEVSASLTPGSPWNSGASFIEETVLGDDGGVVQTVRARDLTSANPQTPQRFMRLKVAP